MTTRTERDSFGPIDVPSERYWGAQTERSRRHFAIAAERFAPEFIHAFAMVKHAAACANRDVGGLRADLAEAIQRAADEIVAGRWDDEFPLVVWQTGSGTQTNMNLNEVIANRANETLGGARGGMNPIHPNDHVNKGQSTNDMFPTAMHVAAAIAFDGRLLPAVAALRDALDAKARQWSNVVKIGRTHLMDATPLTVGQEFSGYVAQLDAAARGLRVALEGLLELAVGGTAVGTGLNAHPEFARRVAAALANRTGLAFRDAPNKFAALAAHDAMVAASAACRGVAVALYKIASDIRLLASGPRCGFGELRLPENEPGSSIMPGKVNPTQCEAMTMVCAQVIGLDAAVAFAGTQGHMELNVFKPIIAHNTLHQARLIADACDGFREHCVAGMEVDEARVRELLERSLMLVTALSPVIGYDKAAAIAKDAHARGITLRQAALESGWIDNARYDEVVRPERMISP